MSAHMVRSISYANFQSLLRFGIIFWGEIMEVLKYLNCKRRILRLMSSVNNHMSCREISKDYKNLKVVVYTYLEIMLKNTSSGTKCTYSQI